MKQVTVWCVVGPDGFVYTNIAKASRNSAIDIFSQLHDNWKDMRKRGYTCKKFKLTEVK